MCRSSEASVCLSVSLSVCLSVCLVCLLEELWCVFDFQGRGSRLTRLDSTAGRRYRQRQREPETEGWNERQARAGGPRSPSAVGAFHT